MPEFGTIGHLIELAIQGERINQAIYLRFGKKFERYPEVAAFWNSYAGEENGHAGWLAQLRERAGVDRLNQLADPDILQQAQRALTRSVEELLDGITDLQDAYELANELEHSETNTVFEFLINYFAEDAQTQTFLRAQLNDHIGRLTKSFPEHLRSATLRRGIPAAE